MKRFVISLTVRLTRLFHNNLTIHYHNSLTIGSFSDQVFKFKKHKVYVCLRPRRESENMFSNVIDF